MDDYLKHIYTIEDLNDFINNAKQESTNLDFKSGKELKKGDKCMKEISKDVSAFANSDGGIIVYGIAEKDHVADRFDHVNGNEITKEWLEHVINSRIHRKINNLRIDPIAEKDDIKKSIYVVKIPRSLNAPHMCDYKKYYRRYNFESVAMDEWEVRNLYNRKEKTYLKIREPSTTGVDFKELERENRKIAEANLDINFFIENIGNNIEELYKLEIKIPIPVSQASNKFGNSELFKYPRRYDDSGYEIFSISNISPIFPEEFTKVITANLCINKRNFQSIIDKDIKTKLYYSGGIDEYNFKLHEKWEKDSDFSIEKIFFK